MAVNRRPGGKFTAQYYEAGVRYTVPGSFRTKEQAQRAAEKAKATHEFRPRKPAPESKLLFRIAAQGMMNELRVEPNTLVSYQSLLNKHVLPAIGDVPVGDITRRMLKRLFGRWQDEGLSKHSVRHAKAVISNTLQRLVEDDQLPTNVARGIDLGKSRLPEIEIADRETLDRVMSFLPTDGAQLWMLVQISTGCRPNEIRALRPRDLVDGELHICYVVNEIKAWKKRGLPHFERRFGTKNKDTRRITAPKELVRPWEDYVKKHSLGPDDPLFTQRLVVPPLKPRSADVAIPDDLGTVCSPNGRSYRHGTVNAYATGKCRCDWCRTAIRQNRRRNRSYKKGVVLWRNPDEYVTESQWNRIWQHAWAEAGGTSKRPTARQLRHTHASWLIDAGVKPVKMMQRLGHKDLSVTQRYVRPVNDDRELADAFDAMGPWLVTFEASPTAVSNADATTSSTQFETDSHTEGEDLENWR
ncbi:MAG: tyrosine-type recombinase/integrase [Actinobacteria bacterium]|nr:tyrosine-type recombinase/integrase [Actinomycetota bacterium]